jgi:hypothetical protein
LVQIGYPPSAAGRARGTACVGAFLLVSRLASRRGLVKLIVEIQNIHGVNTTRAQPAMSKALTRLLPLFSAINS